MTERRAAWRAVAFVAGLFTVTAAHAQSPREVSLRVRDCNGGALETSGALIELVRLELRAEGVVRVIRSNPQAQSGVALWIERACDRAADAWYALGFEDPSRERHLERSLSVEDVAIALRERALALALAELFRAGEAETSPALEAHAAEASAAAPIAPEAPPPSAPAAATDSTERSTDSTRAPQPARTALWILALGPAVQVLPARVPAMFGAEVAVGWRRLRAGMLGVLANDTDRLGDVDYRRLHGFATYDAFWTAPAALRVTAGVRAEVGATFADVKPGAAALAQNVRAASGALALESSLGWRIDANWHTALRLDLGYAFGPRLRADDRELADFRGLYLGASLCVGVTIGTDDG